MYREVRNSHWPCRFFSWAHMCFGSCAHIRLWGTEKIAEKTIMWFHCTTALISQPVLTALWVNSLSVSISFIVDKKTRSLSINHLTVAKIHFEDCSINTRVHQVAILVSILVSGTRCWNKGVLKLLYDWIYGGLSLVEREKEEGFSLVGRKMINQLL